MKYNDKANLIAGLRKAMGDDRELYSGECMDGKYIAERIAFEEYSDEQKAALRKKYAKTDEQIEQQRQKIINDRQTEAKFKAALRNRDSILSSRNAHNTDLIGKEQFYV